ncbi:L-seryl-tRNA(Sec) selenium transferase [Streptomyces vastus]|uniref:L-seryl-tRNA(Sec) selenium transferase n=1 Tax=Streptomyces vastus TaxID=285451 RepID=UPI003CD080E8
MPRTDVILADGRLQEPLVRLGRSIVKNTVQAVQARVRAGDTEADAAVEAVLAALPAETTGHRRVLNASGVLLHTNLGRAPLSEAALRAVSVTSGTTDLEFDLETGRRGRRGRGALAALAQAIPAAEGVHLVNNGAAALVLAATAMARDREIIVSRGEMVEIGDGFRLPDLLESTGARLREVGTTNRTVLRDYTDAIGPSTGFILKVHPSNFVIKGFTAAASVRELAGVGAPVVVDIGSGLLRPHPTLPDEPDAETVLRDGADLVTASGDKLLGGPQAGLIAGRRELVEKLRRHPLARGLRIDKLTLAAMEATLCGPPAPVMRYLQADLKVLLSRAEALAASLTCHGVDAYEVPSEATVGGGAAPGVVLPSAAVSVPASLALALRLGTPAVVGRVERDRCLLDLRALDAADDAIVCEAVLGAVGREQEGRG